MKILCRFFKASKRKNISSSDQFELSDLLKSLPGSVYWKDLNGVYLGCNDYMTKIIGLESPDQVIGKTDYDLCWHEQAGAIRNIDQEVINTGIEKTIEETGKLINGTLTTYLTSKKPLRDKNNNIIGIFGISMDISEIKKREQEQIQQKIEAQNQYKLASIYLENILANLPEPIYWLDKEGGFLGCNPSEAAIFGLSSPSELIGKTMYDIGEILGWKKDVSEALRQNDINIMKSKNAQIIEEVAIAPNGEIRTYISHKAPLFDENKNVIGIIGTSIDISKRKIIERELKEAKEKAEAANKTKSEFLAAINHELRTPLTGMLGTARLLSTESLEPEHHKQVDDIITAGQHLLALVNDLLDLSKLEAGKFELNNSPLDLRKLIEEVATMLSAQAKDRSLEIRINYSADTPHLIMGDAKAIRQILLNLAGNAIKFTHEGYIEIKVECVEKAKNNAKFKLSVNDTGIGIPADKLNSIFDRFNQVDNSRTRKYGGTGLGLTINKAYVALMGGTIEVQSEEDKGSSFICEVPFDLQSEDKLLSSWDPYKSKVRILIVDESSRADVVKKHIGSSYTEIVPCTDALNYLLTAQQANQPFDIAIMDDELKVISANELAQKINQQKAIKKPLLILMMKDSSLPKKNEAKQVGFFECLNKPVHPTELLASLTAAWEKWEERTKPQHRIEPITNKQLKVLLVEDDPIIQKVHGMMLKALGCIVDIAANGPKALQMCDTKYDTIFMDVGLGEMSGLETAQKIRNNENGINKRTPIIAMTGYGDEDSKASCLASGMDDLTLKPTTPEILKDLLEKWVVIKK